MGEVSSPPAPPSKLMAYWGDDKVHLDVELRAWESLSALERLATQPQNGAVGHFVENFNAKRIYNVEKDAWDAATGGETLLYLRLMDQLHWRIKTWDTQSRETRGQIIVALKRAMPECQYSGICCACFET